ncbi:MAG: ABC transporter permease subunit [Clostridia bacterium]|nr:ABC transporter permease subunit [Clostridia bacterium]
MGKLIKSDFMKLSKSRTLLICSLIALVLGAVMSLLFINAWNSVGESIQQAQKMMLDMGMDEEVVEETFSILPKPYIWSYANMLLGDGTITLLAAICISVFTASEYSMGTLKNTVSRGFTRGQIYLSKLVVSCVSTLILTAAYLIGGMTVCLIFVRGTSELNFGQMAMIAVTQILLLFAMASLYYTIAIIIKKTGSTVAMSIVLPTFVSTMIVTTTYGDKDFAKIARYWLFETPVYVQKFCLNGQIYIPLLLAAGYFAVTVAAGYLTFRRQDC